MSATSARMLVTASLVTVAAACVATPVPPPEHRSTPPHAVTSVSVQKPPDAAPPAASDAGTEPGATPEVVVDAQGCVRDPLAHAAQFIVDHHPTEVTERLGRAPERADFKKSDRCFGSSSLPDLDGDGVDETEIHEACSWGTYGALRLLYFSNKGCPRFAGDLVSGELSTLDTSGAGVRDLEATWSNGCAGNDFEWSHYRWDGKAYRVIDKATCYLCADRSVSKPPRGANSHPHCKAEAKARAAP